MFAGACHFNHFRGPTPFRGRHRIAHVGPVENVILRLAVQAHRVGGRGGSRLEWLLLTVVRILIDDQVPDLEAAARLRQVAPAVLGHETSAERAVHHELIKQHEGVRARRIMLFGEAVRRHQLFPSRIRRRPRGLRLLGPRKLVPVHVVHRLELFLVTGATGGRIHLGGRTLLGLTQVLVDSVVATVAPDALVLAIGVKRLDRRVTAITR